MIRSRESFFFFFYQLSRLFRLGRHERLFFRETIRLDSRWIELLSSGSFEPFDGNNRKAVTRPPILAPPPPFSLAIYHPLSPLSLILSFRESFLPSLSLHLSLSLSIYIYAAGSRKGDPVGKIMALRVKSRMHIKRYYFAR